jgi:hypothetical protein
MVNPTALAWAVLPEPTSYEEVIQRLSAVDASLDADDGLRWFNRLYLQMTEAVAIAARANRYVDPVFMLTLDCKFAELYLRALRQGLIATAQAPRAWQPLFEARGRRDLLGLQHALAGINAHINRDLPVALVDTYEALGGEPERDSARHRDYLTVDRILGEVQEVAKTWLLTEALGHLDRSLGQADDLLALWSFGRAREAAWTTAEVRWCIRASTTLSRHNLLALDRFVGFASRSLLQPLASGHGRSLLSDLRPP